MVNLMSYCCQIACNYSEKVYERFGKNIFWSFINSAEVLYKLKARDFNATSLSTYDISTL